MRFSNRQLWDRFKTLQQDFPSLGLSLDVSRMNFPDGFYEAMEPQLVYAFDQMAKLEAGAIANPDENRRVGHYWLRNPALAPEAALRKEIEATQQQIQDFAAQVHQGKIIPSSNVRYSDVLVIGIGGSALGPQFVYHALRHPSKDKMRLHFFDNTDPDGIDRVLRELGSRLDRTLCVTISKSGGTKETRNGMLEAKAAFTKANLDFAARAVAITGRGSELDLLAQKEGWLQRFPMWDWVGGRTSETSAVGLLPAALHGADIAAILAGAKACDDVTRVPDARRNPAAQLALMWFYAGDGRGRKDMVILPYKDRLELFSRYLQQLVMESLGKERETRGNQVHQGIAVYGNKGSTDQHAYVQQLRDGVNNFFVTFVRVLKDREGESIAVEPNVTSGDYLDGFLLGTRQALYENNRESLTITIRDVSPFSVGVLIALYERAVGLYASVIGVNAYHQPGVEAGKKAAGSVLSVQQKVLEFLRGTPGKRHTAEMVAEAIGRGDDPETVYHVLEHLAANARGVERTGAGASTDAEFGIG